MELVAEYASAGYRIAMGHGPVVRGGRAVELVEANLARLRDMPRVIKGLLEKPMSVGELAYRASRLMGAEPGVEGLILNEVPVKAVLSYLVDEGVVEPLASERGVLWARRN